MKKSLLLASLLSISLLVALGQTDKPETPKSETPKAETGKKFNTAEAATLIGKNATLVGKVSGVKQTDTVTHINFDKPFPNQTFTAVLFAKNSGSFTNLDKLIGKTVEISGKVEDYKGKPQIVLQTKNQLTVVEKTAEKSADKKEADEKSKTEK